MTAKQKQAAKAATKRNSETRKAPKKIVTRRSRSEVQAERELSKHLTGKNNQQREQLRIRRAAPEEKPRTPSQREKITELAEYLGLTYAALHGRLRRAKSYKAAQSLIKRMSRDAAELDATVSQMEYELTNDHDWLKPAEAELSAEDAKALDRDIERVKWLSIGGLVALLIFMVGWFARGV